MSNSQPAAEGQQIKIQKDLEGFEKCLQSRDCYRFKGKEKI